MDNYNDIINLPHHISKKHPQMSIYQRSAQFAPFAALTGYEGQIKETARLTDKRIEIDDELKKILDIKLQIITNLIQTHPEVSITYFVPDTKKDGGSYNTITDCIIKIDNYHNFILLNSEIKINIFDIIAIEGEIFKSFDFLY